MNIKQSLTIGNNLKGRNISIQHRMQQGNPNSDKVGVKLKYYVKFLVND